MQYEDFIKDFAERTFENLQIVCDRKDREEKTGYEVTQLVNSCVGLLVFPKEEYFATLWKDEPTMNFPNPQIQNVARKIVCSQQLGNIPCRCSSHFGHMLRHLRNAVAHGRITTIPDVEVEEIEKICFTDQREKRDGNTVTTSNIVNIELTIEDVYNVLMSVFYIILEGKGFPWNDAEECAKRLKVKLDIGGVVKNE